MCDNDLNKSIAKALEAVAENEGISVESVRREIEAAIAAARLNEDPAARAFWDSILAKDGEALSAEEMIAIFVWMNMDTED